MTSHTHRFARSLLLAVVVLAAACTGSESADPGRAADQPARDAAPSAAASAQAGGDTVVIKTNRGEITVELNREKAPVTVKNFLSYVDRGFYDGTIFHRVIPGFMIQGGGFDTKYTKKPTGPPIKNEAGNGLTNDNLTIAMARTSVIDSATSQFFINVVDNRFLNHKSDRAGEYGYAVFGKVVAGEEVVQAIASTPTENRGGPFANAPVEQVVIESIRRK